MIDAEGADRRRKMDGDGKKQLRAAMLADRSTSAVEKLRNLDSSERERSGELVKSPRNSRKSFGRAINGDFS